ncbi:MAG: hypothetical protein COS89_04150 [Deltaproteobacteria bacterium CG07_land_8_20_14_0_80_38_7]|nr:MAG: hypothetical protein COS89_04150 [Deltaproteobacteria bacterium CG07_land_8_20_14_0_80_38_7]
MELKLGSVNLDRLKLQNLYNVYLGMTTREQTIALIAAAIIALLIIILPVMAASSRISKLERDVDTASTKISDIMYEINQLNEVKAKLTNVESELEGGFDASISTTLETLANKSGISDRIDSLKEKPVASSDLFDEASVDVRLKKISLQEMINYLFSIEHNSDKLLRLKRLEITPRYDNPNEFNVSFQVSTYRLQER